MARIIEVGAHLIMAAMSRHSRGIHKQGKRIAEQHKETEGQKIQKWGCGYHM